MDKIQNLKDLEYYGNILLCTELANKLIKLKPHNKELKKLGDGLLNIAIYVVGLQDDLNKHKEAISDYRYKKNQAILKCRDLERKLKNNIKFPNKTLSIAEETLLKDGHYEPFLESETESETSETGEKNTL